MVIVCICLIEIGFLWAPMVFNFKSFYKGSFGGCQGQPSARPWHLLIRSLGLAALPPPSVRLLYVGYCLYSLPYRPLSSTLLCDSCSACLLSTVHPGNMPYIPTV